MKKIILAIGMTLMAGLASAILLCEEPWDYGIGSDSSSWTNGAGFDASAWNPNAYNPSGASIVSGLTLGYMPVSGNAVHVTMTADTVTFGTLRRRMATTSVTSGDVWVSYLFAFDTAGSTVPADEALQVRSSGTMRTGIYENDSKVYLQRGTVAYTGIDPSIKGGDTLLYVAKFADMGNEVIDSKSLVWVVSAAGYGSMMANGGLSETNLDSYAITKAVNTDQSIQTLAWNANLEILPLGVNGATPSFTVDEIRYGTALEDVIPIQGGYAYLYEGWAVGYNLTNGMEVITADPDEDGMENLLEYALNGNPTNSDAAIILPSSQLDGSGATNMLSYIYKRRISPAAFGLSYTVEVTDDLIATNWMTVADSGTSNIDTSWEWATNSIPAIKVYEFMRLRVGYN